MKTTEFNSSILEGTYVIGNVVQMKDGFIQDNPFSKRVGSCLAAHWLIENQELAKSKIREVMREQRLGVHEVDECFDYAVYFFSEKEERDFNPDYFGDEASETYSIDIYCLYKLKMIVYEYRNEMKKRLNSEVHLVDDIDKEDGEKVPKKCISYDILAKASFDEEKENYGFNEILEFEELQEIFDIDLPYYTQQFRILGMNNFDFRSYVYHMFLSEEPQLDGFNLKEESVVKIAKALGMTPSALKKINRIIKETVKKRSDLFGELPMILDRLIQGKLKGWKPIF